MVSPDNKSREAINEAIHYVMQDTNRIRYLEYRMKVLVARQEVTGADRQWAAQYEPGNVVRYTKGSKALGISQANTLMSKALTRKESLTVEPENGQRLTYDPRRLQGVTLYRETERAFSEGDRVQFTAPNSERHVANRELGTVEKIDASRQPPNPSRLRSHIAFNIRENPHLDYGYAVTSHSSQGQTADRVLVHVDTEQAGEKLVNRRLAYVASRVAATMRKSTPTTNALLPKGLAAMSHIDLRWSPYAQQNHGSLKTASQTPLRLWRGSEQSNETSVLAARRATLSLRSPWGSSCCFIVSAAQP